MHDSQSKITTLPGSTITAVEVIPNPIRVFSALRNLGYSFNSAVADLLDNSISAGATEIAVKLKRDDGFLNLTIQDNGCGMNPLGLREAMRLGSEEEYQAGSLGKFGMGLKTASLSQCRRLGVYTRTRSSNGLSASVWDLDHIEQTGRWEVLELLDDHAVSSFPCAVPEPSGTVVAWEKMDRLEREFEAFQRPGAAVNWFARVLGDLRLHLRMVFHRFLDGSLPQGRQVTLIFNGDPLLPWDPFCKAEANTCVLQPRRFSPAEVLTNAHVRIEPYILPVKEGKGGFSSLPAWQEASGLLSWNDSQGYYVYRENRLIHFGGWLRTRAKDEHTKYARVGLFFGSELDEAFSISVNKSQLRLPASLMEYLKTEINPEATRAAQLPYRTAVRQGEAGARHSRSTALVNQTAPRMMARQHVDVHQGTRDEVIVTNPKGSFAANSVFDALALHASQRFAVQTGVVEDGRLWKLVCKPDGGFVVVLNLDHPFYQHAYESGHMNASMTSFMDAVLFAMAYAELASASNRTLPLFSEIRDTVSYVLKDLVLGPEDEQGI